MAEPIGYYGLAIVRDARGQLVEQVWAVLAWEPAGAAAGWRGTLTPAHGTAFAVLHAGHAGQRLRLVLPHAPTVAAAVLLLQYEAPLARGGAVVRSALLAVSGLSPLPVPPPAEAEA